MCKEGGEFKAKLLTEGSCWEGNAHHEHWQENDGIEKSWMSGKTGPSTQCFDIKGNVNQLIIIHNK